MKTKTNKDKATVLDLVAEDVQSLIARVAKLEQYVANLLDRVEGLERGYLR